MGAPPAHDWTRDATTRTLLKTCSKKPAGAWQVVAYAIQHRPLCTAAKPKDWIMRTLTALCIVSFFWLGACGDSAEINPPESDAEANPLPDVPAVDGAEGDTVDPDAPAPDGGDGVQVGDVITYEDDCGDGLICILGECLERSKSTSCLAFGQCCEEDSEDCTFGEDGCFCDADCVEAGDCCPDACAACEFCNEDGNAVAPSCTDCLAKDCGDCADCQDAVSTCDEPGDDCAKEGEMRCGEDAAGHYTEICTQLDTCRRWIQDTYCHDLNFCTQVADVCVDGACEADGDPNDACDAPDDPCMIAVCDEGTGVCSEEPAALQDPCDDGSLCIINETCFNGDCTGIDIGPIEGTKSTDYFTDSDVYYIDLAGVELGITDKIDGYACGEQGVDYDGSEFSIEVASTFDFADFSIVVALELEDATLAGSEYADVMVMGKVPGTCWPDACLFGGMMGEDGRLELELPVEAAKQSWTLVIDGRDGFEGRVRMAVSYPGKAVEAYCANGEDDDGDGNTDCEDLNCFESDYCGVETACSDGADNDLDGFEDCLDSDCATDPTCLPEQDCEGEADTDGDGLTGCDDPDCNGVGDCGAVVECANATPISCFETISDQSLANGSDQFTGVAMPSCGDISPETFNVHKQLIYDVQMAEGCTGFTPHVSPQLLQSVYALGPDCSEDACNNAGYAGFGTGIGGGVFDASLTEGWIVVGAPDSDSAPIANTSFEIYLDCTCE
jgi:hypothetical protein